MDQKQQIKNIQDIQLKPDLFALVCAKRGAGKTVLNKSLVYELLQRYTYTNLILISDTYGIELNGAYDKLVQKNMVFHSSKMDNILLKVMDYQKKHKKPDQYVMIILDDVNLSKKSKGMLQLVASQGRHFHIACILLCQFPKIFVDNIIRSNLDIIFTGPQNQSGKEALFEAMNINMSRKQFYQYLIQNTKNHQFVLYNTINQDDNDDELQIIKVDNIEIYIDNK